MSDTNDTKQFTSNSTFADFLYTMGDVVSGKISFEYAVKDLHKKDKEKAKDFLDNAKKSFNDLIKSIKDKKRDLDMQAKYDMSSALKTNLNGKTSYIGVKEKPKESWLKQMTKNLGRTLKNSGSVLTGEKTITQALHDEANAVQDSLSNNSNIYRGFRATMEVSGQRLNAWAKRKKELRGIETPKTQQPKKEINPYDKLDNEQFSVAMHTAYYNIVRMENFGPLMPDSEKDKAIAEINRLMESANKRYPNTDTSDKGAYFKDTKLQNVEAQLFAYMKKDCEKNPDNNLVKEEMQKYNSWRQGKNYTVEGPIMSISEAPFNNIELYGGITTKEIDSLHGEFTANDHLYKPLERGQNVMSEKDIAIAKAQLEKLKVY